MYMAMKSTNNWQQDVRKIATWEENGKCPFIQTNATFCLLLEIKVRSTLHGHRAVPLKEEKYLDLTMRQDFNGKTP